MAERLRLIGITRPGTADNTGAEAQRIVALLDSGALERMHIRKDDAAEAYRLIDALPARLHGRLSLHRVPVPDGSQVRAHGGETGSSCSCHSLDEAEAEIGRRDYLFVSPVFDSISKPGYRAVTFDTDRIRRLSARGSATLTALGGVTPERLAQVRQMGFGGAAMLGCLWTGDVNEIIDKLLCYNL